jgi:cytochrome c553
MKPAVVSMALFLFALASAAQAQGNPVAGKSLFENGSGSTQSCVACHGNVENRRAAIDPGGDLDFDLVRARFLQAITAYPSQMGQYNAGFTEQQKNDVAAYIADVPKARPNLVDFRASATGVETAPVTITFRHAVTATAPLTLGAVGMSGPNPTDFRIRSAGTTCANNLVLAPGASCTVNVSFLPSTTGTKSALLNFPYTQGSTNVTRTAQLSGAVDNQPPPGGGNSAAGGGGALALGWIPLLFAALGLKRRGR